MSHEVVINLATALVLQKEAEYMNALRRKVDRLAERNPLKSEEALEALIAEAKRLNYLNHQADEEEILIYFLEKKKK